MIFFLYSLEVTGTYLEPSRTFMEFFFCENSKPLTIFVKALHDGILTEFYINLRRIAQSLFRTQSNIYDGAFLQK